MSLWLIPLFFAIYFIIVLVLTRMRAEQGFPVHAMENMPNHHILVDGFGTRILGTNNLVALTLYRWFNRSYTSHPMPHQLEGFKLSERSGIAPRRLFFALLGVSGVRCRDGVRCYPLYLLYLWCFEYGGWQRLGNRFWWPRLQRTPTLDLLPHRTEPPSPLVVSRLAYSSRHCLMFMRARFFWWPLPPDWVRCFQ